MEFSLPLDKASEDDLARSVRLWASRPALPQFDPSIVDQYLNSVMPRSIFLKNLRAGAKLLDLGAGNGALSIYKSWPALPRQDIEMYAVSLERGEYFAKYAGCEIGDFEDGFPDFGGMLFDGILCSHFIEHLRAPERVFQFAAERLQPGGRIYLEWPHPIAKKMPPRKVIPNYCGVESYTLRFDDDATHIEAWEAQSVARMLAERALQVEGYGRVYLPFLADELRNHARTTKSQVSMTFALWLRYGWAQWLVAGKSLAALPPESRSYADL